MDFVANTELDKQAILKELGISSVEELLSPIPKLLRIEGLDLPEGLSEPELTRLIKYLAGQNKSAEDLTCFLGAGAYDHFIPSVVDQLASRGEFQTAYTPYQAEASQGTLQVIYEFQSLICELTGMDVANASMYEGASAVAEACLLALRFTGRKKVVFSNALHPEYRQVVHTLLAGLEESYVELSHEKGRFDLEALEKAVDEETACVVVQHPNFFGLLEEVDAVERIAHQQGALLIAVTNPAGLGVLNPPGAFGADLAVAEGQPLGIPLSFGGPYLGLLAAKEAFLRKIPGRLCGITTDAGGRRAFVLTLQAREQHIRRKNATSNICTNQALMATAATITMALLGKQGIRKLGLLNLAKSHYAKKRLLKSGRLEDPFGGDFFNEFVIQSKKKPVSELNLFLLAEGILGGLDLGRFYPGMEKSMLVCVTEMRTRSEIDHFAGVLERI